MRRRLQEPAAPSLIVFGALVAAGFVVIGLGWGIADGTATPAFQVPALVSGGLGGLVLIALGCGLTFVQVGRLLAARERVQTEDLLDTIDRLLAAREEDRR